jgi:sporulation protein YlmC with PRC-barrel domain
MLRSLKALEHYKVNTSDGEIGSVVNFLIDDERWGVRYLVVQAGGPLFLDGRRVLISPISFARLDWPTQRFHLALTMDKVKNSPSIDLDKPVSRQHERHYSRYYGHPYYWGYSGFWGVGGYPTMLAAGSGTINVPAEDSAFTEDSASAEDPAPDVHLRSDEEVRGYHVEGSDGTIGHIEDFIIDDETWGVRYLVVNTRNWWFGKNVLVAPQWANRISWAERKVYVGLSRQAIKGSPEWNGADAINRAYEARLYDYYGRPAYRLGGASKSRARIPHERRDDDVAHE